MVPSIQRFQGGYPFFGGDEMDLDLSGMGGPHTKPAAPSAQVTRPQGNLRPHQIFQPFIFLKPNPFTPVLPPTPQRCLSLASWRLIQKAMWVRKETAFLGDVRASRVSRDIAPLHPSPCLAAETSFPRIAAGKAQSPILFIFRQFCKTPADPFPCFLVDRPGFAAPSFPGGWRPLPKSSRSTESLSDSGGRFWEAEIHLAGFGG